MSIKVRDGRGEHNAAIARENRQRIVEWFEANPGATVSECARALCLARPTVSRHVERILSEVTPDEA